MGDYSSLVIAVSVIIAGIIVLPDVFHLPGLVDHWPNGGKILVGEPVNIEEIKLSA